MKIRRFFVLVFIIIAIIITAFMVIRNHQKHNKSAKQEEWVEEYEDGDYDEIDCMEHGPELFCNYINGDQFPKTDFYSDMIEVYNAYMLYNGIKSVTDVWYRYEDPEEAIDALQYADVNVLQYDDIRLMMSRAIELGKSALCNDFDHIDTVAYEQYHDQLAIIDSTLANRFNVFNYVSFTDEEFWNAIDYKEPTKDTDDHLKAMQQVEDFDLKCDHAMAYVYDGGFYEVDPDMLEDLLDDGRYSPQLFFLWRIWRCRVQLSTSKHGQFGPSTWSMIPNQLYNEKRLHIAETTLKHIAEHPDDIYAVNQYLVTSAMPNILRAGEYYLGNQSFMEIYYLGFLEDD